MSPNSNPQRRSERGLTLLEVLAAFMIFSLVFTALVGSSQNAVRQQGTSFRRLEANEIADEVLVDIEVELAARGIPLIESELIDRDPYTVRIQDAPLGGSPDVGPAGGFGPDAGLGNEADSAGGFSAGGLNVATLLATQMPEIAPFFRQYEIEVAWQEGARQMAVRRVALGFDWTAASDVFAALLPPGAAGPGSDPTTGGEGDNDSTDGDSGRDRGDRGRASESEVDRMKRLIEEAQRRTGVQ